jgi:hypothetical protein
MLAGVGDAARSLARFVAADSVEVARVTPGRLRAPLVRTVRDPAPPAAAALSS